MWSSSLWGHKTGHQHLFLSWILVSLHPYVFFRTWFLQGFFRGKIGLETKFFFELNLKFLIGTSFGAGFHFWGPKWVVDTQWFVRIGSRELDLDVCSHKRRAAFSQAVSSISIVCFLYASCVCSFHPCYPMPALSFRLLWPIIAMLLYIFFSYSDSPPFPPSSHPLFVSQRIWKCVSALVTRFLIIMK